MPATVVSEDPVQTADKRSSDFSVSTVNTIPALILETVGAHGSYSKIVVLESP